MVGVWLKTKKAIVRGLNLIQQTTEVSKQEKGVIEPLFQSIRLIGEIGEEKFSLQTTESQQEPEIKHAMARVEVNICTFTVSYRDAAQAKASLKLLQLLTLQTQRAGIYRTAQLTGEEERGSLKERRQRPGVVGCWED